MSRSSFFLAALGVLAPAAARADLADWLPAKGFVAVPPATPPHELPQDISSEQVWTRESDGMTEQIVAVRARGPLSLVEYLARWRRNHACAMKNLPALLVGGAVG